MAKGQEGLVQIDKTGCHGAPGTATTGDEDLDLPGQ